MKALTNLESKAATKMAYGRIYSIGSLLNFKGSNKKFDRRTRIGKKANYLMLQFKLSDERKREILRIKKDRALSKSFDTCNYITDPLFLDFLRNRKNGTFQVVFKHDGTAFIKWNNGRNHWAKNERQMEILKVISKYN